MKPLERFDKSQIPEEEYKRIRYEFAIKIDYERGISESIIRPDCDLFDYPNPLHNHPEPKWDRALEIWKEDKKDGLFATNPLSAIELLKSEEKEYQNRDHQNDADEESSATFEAESCDSPEPEREVLNEGKGYDLQCIQNFLLDVAGGNCAPLTLTEMHSFLFDRYPGTFQLRPSRFEDGRIGLSIQYVNQDYSFQVDCLSFSSGQEVKEASEIVFKRLLQAEYDIIESRTYGPEKPVDDEFFLGERLERRIFNDGLVLDVNEIEEMSYYTGNDYQFTIDVFWMEHHDICRISLLNFNDFAVKDIKFRSDVGEDEPFSSYNELDIRICKVIAGLELEYFDSLYGAQRNQTLADPRLLTEDQKKSLDAFAVSTNERIQTKLLEDCDVSEKFSFVKNEMKECICKVFEANDSNEVLLASLYSDDPYSDPEESSENQIVEGNEHCDGECAGKIEAALGYPESICRNPEDGSVFIRFTDEEEVPLEDLDFEGLYEIYCNRLPLVYGRQYLIPHELVNIILSLYAFEVVNLFYLAIFKYRMDVADVFTKGINPELPVGVVYCDYAYMRTTFPRIVFDYYDIGVVFGDVCDLTYSLVYPMYEPCDRISFEPIDEMVHLGVEVMNNIYLELRRVFDAEVEKKCKEINE